MAWVMASGALSQALGEPPPAFLLKWGSDGTGDGMGVPYSIAVGPLGDVYVTDVRNKRVQRFSPQGEFAAKWGGPGDGAGEFGLGAPAGMDVD